MNSTYNENNQKLSERFEAAFNQIHEFLKNTVKIHDDRFQVLLNVGAKRHTIINKYRDDLTKYAKLRNVIVHEKTEIDYYIAEPHIKTVEHIEKISTIFNKPNYALSIATEQVVYFDYEDSILLAIEAIKKHSYSQFPVYRDKECIGLLTNGAIVKGMAEHIQNGVVDLYNIKMKDMVDHIAQQAIEFVPKSIDLFEIEDMFEVAHQKKKKIEAMIITETGKANEKPLGLISAWDLIEIDYTID